MAKNRSLRKLPARLIMLAAGALLASGVGSAGSRKPQQPQSRMPTLKPAVFDDTLAIEGEELAARKVESRLVVEVGVNGTGPYRFVVDSGADTSVIGERLARALGLPLGNPALLHGITESRQVDRVLVGSLHVGSAVFRDLELPRLKEGDLGASGIIGLDALVEQRVVLDFDKRKVTIDDGARPVQRLDGEIVVTARLQRGQLILTQVRAGSQILDAVVDTGSEISIGNSALREKVLRNKRARFTQLEVTGVTGATVLVDVAIVPELRLGPVVLANVPIAFADVPPFAVFGIDQQPSLLLGTDLMENFRKVSLDFHNRKVRFQLRRCTSEGIVINTTGTASRITSEKGNSAVCAG